MNYALIFAGGMGNRMGSNIPKQFLEVDAKPILIHSVENFSNHPSIDGIVIVSIKEYIHQVQYLIDKFGVGKVMKIVAGGSTGQESIFNGLKALRNELKISENSLILIHDGVRPNINSELISNSIECAINNGNSIAVSDAIETVIYTNSNEGTTRILDRSNCFNAKAPQVFRLGDIYKYHLNAQRDCIFDFVDSATLASYYNVKLATIKCNPDNIKITTPNDYFTFKALYAQNQKKG